jgi:hypothetical protein
MHSDTGYLQGVTRSVTTTGIVWTINWVYLVVFLILCVGVALIILLFWRVSRKKR